MKCDECKYFRPSETPGGCGVCQRFPPTVISNTEGVSGACLYPIVNPLTDWCGEFKANLKPKDKPAKPFSYPIWFDVLWDAYPRQGGANGPKPGKREAYDVAITIPNGDRQDLLKAVKAYRRVVEAGEVKPRHAKRFLTNDFWKDYIPKAMATSRRKSNAQATAEFRERQMWVNIKNYRKQGFPDNKVVILVAEDGYDEQTVRKAVLGEQG